MVTWMIVEDEPDLFTMLVVLAQTLGHTALAFPDAARALAWIDDLDAKHTSPTVPTVALIDIRLPESSGLEVSNRLRHSPLLSQIGITLMTAYRLSPQQEREVMRKSGADILLYKPLPDLQKLQGILAQAVLQRQNAAAAAG